MMTKGLDKIEQTAAVLKAMDAYVERAVSDYAAFCGVIGSNYNETDETVKQRVEEFRNGLDFQIGKKWIKVVAEAKGTGRRVHGFVCIEDHGKFKVGDLAKPASWHQPAKNFARGNVLSGDIKRVNWTGVL